MKTVKLIIVVAIVLIIVLSGCAAKANDTPTLIPEEGNTPSMTPEMENTPVPTSLTVKINIEDLDPEKVAERAEQSIKASAEESGVVEEYWVACNIPKGKTVYDFKLQVYEDGAGSFSYVIKRDEWLEDKETIFINEVLSINKDDTNKLLKAIADNDFWNIPTVHPDEKMGFDGRTISITGYSKGNTHHISMWEPGKDYGIYKIFKTFYEYGNNIKEDPLDIVRIDDFGA